MILSPPPQCKHIAAFAHRTAEKESIINPESIEPQSCAYRRTSGGFVRYNKVSVVLKVGNAATHLYNALVG